MFFNSLGYSNYILYSNKMLRTQRSWVHPWKGRLMSTSFVRNCENYWILARIWPSKRTTIEELTPKLAG